MTRSPEMALELKIKSDFTNWYPEHFLWNCLKWVPQNPIGSSNGLVPAGSKPLHKPALTQISVTIWWESLAGLLLSISGIAQLSGVYVPFSPYCSNSMCPFMWKRKKMDNFMCFLVSECTKRLKVHSQAISAFWKWSPGTMLESLQIWLLDLSLISLHPSAKTYIFADGMALFQTLSRPQWFKQGPSITTGYHEKRPLRCCSWLFIAVNDIMQLNIASPASDWQLRSFRIIFQYAAEIKCHKTWITVRFR